MSIIKLNINSLAFLVFLLIFPLDYIAYIFSHISYGVPLGILGNILSILLIFLFFYYKKIRLSDIYMLGILCCFLVLMVLSSASDGLDFFYWLKTVGMFFSGMMMYDFLYQKNNFLVNRVVAILFLIMIGLVLIYSVDGNYLRLSDSFVLVSLFLISYQKKFLMTLLIIMISLFSLYLIGSRSGVLIYSVISIILIYMKFGFLRFLIFIPPGLYYIYIFLVGLNSSISNYNDNRLLRLIFQRDEDTSLNLRKTFNDLGFEVYLRNPFLGDFGYYRNIYGEGAYAHNYLSYLAEFGFIGLLFLMLLLYFYIRFCFKMIHLKTDYNIYIFSIGTFCIIGLLTAKSYYWIIPFLALGLLYRASSTNKNEV